MKRLLFILLLFIFSGSFAQQEKFELEGRIVNGSGRPVADAYILNFRNSDKNITNTNGVFSIWVLPGDSLMISHVSYYRKIVTVYSLLVNPVIELVMDTINIREVNISPNQKTDKEKAMDNIESIEFDFRPQPDDGYSDAERMQELLNTENRVLRAEASSISLLRFSPSEQIGKMIEKSKKRKKARQYSSTKKRKRGNEEPVKID